MTRLTALELFGFKSFADRTRFEFPAGMTAVVGPNGSGKSNVVDAIKWVLGEQSVRSLRGKEMTDVIFAGSTGRKPLNMAEVSLIFDNTARELPVTADAVQITRRVYRSGESEYLVNGETSRLRDIRELFSGTGAATEAYSVIEQGRVDALLVASGRDRRAVFEEAAGITRFRARRTEALRRLERAEQNRQRLADIVGEVASRLETVRHQAARARRWKTMHDRLRRLRLVAASRDLAGVAATVTAVEATLATTRGALHEQEQLAASGTADVAGLTETEAQLQPRLGESRAIAGNATQRAAAAEATARLQRGRRADVEADLARATAAVADAVREEARTRAVAAAAAAAVASEAALLDELIARLGRCESAAADSQQDAAAARTALAAATAALDDIRLRHLRLEADHERAAGRAGEARAAATEARDRVTAARERLAALGQTRAACEGNVESLLGRLAAVTADVESLEAAQRHDAAALEAAWHELAGWKSACEACRERREMLQEIVGRQEGVSDAARLLIANGGPAVSGFSGVLADLLVAGIDWAALVDLALGELGQSLVVGSVDEAIQWHTAWSSTADADAVRAAGGRVGLAAPAGLRSPLPFEPAPHPGIIGRLDTLIGIDPESDAGATVAARLLGRVWVVERIEHALPLLADCPADVLFLTRDGVSLSADGVLGFGTPAAATSLVARRSELRALDQRYDDLIRAVERSQGGVAAVQERIATRESELAQATSRRQRVAEQIATSRAELARVVRDERDGQEGIDTALRQARTADQRAAAAEATAAEVRTRLDEAADAVGAAEREAERRRAAIDAVERDRGAAVDEMQQLRVDRAAATEKLARCRDAAAAAAADLEVRRAAVEATRLRLRDGHHRVAGWELDLLAATSAQAEATWADERAAAQLTELAAEAERLDVGRRTLLAAVDASRDAAARLAEQVHALELEAGEARHQRARIIERIRDEYDIDIEAESAAGSEPAPDEEPVPEDRGELEARIEELRRKLASMTSVNMEALAEAEQLAERLATLEAQLADVTGGRESIEQLIARIDEESRRLLGETIETVRGHFRELFERVFGGGQADIVLEPGVDLLETAVEIVARPPGKEPRSISLLSGGEKTMTCVALLLAIFRSRPSPFCVLDEVDAALDEANVDRFSGVLRDFLSSTQFIVVTHSKKTMAAANTLYGVTMEESGISKRVSVRFESAATATRPVSRAA
jgi:chromosome segregation protein